MKQLMKDYEKIEKKCVELFNKDCKQCCLVDECKEYGNIINKLTDLKNRINFKLLKYEKVGGEG